MDGLMDKDKMGENASVVANNDDAAAAATGADKRRKVRDLPENMTVEEFLNAERDRQIAEIHGYAEKLVANLESEYQNLKSEFLEQLNEEADRKAQAANSGTVTLTLFVQEGHFKDKTFTVALKAGKPAMIGRSRGAKFKAPSGISLSGDAETSTTHGRFDLTDAGTCTFTDVGSTNGSKLNGKALKKNEPAPFTEGDVLFIGSNDIKLVSISSS